MSAIDLSQLITAEQKALDEEVKLIAGRKDECRNRIFEVVDQITQMNLAATAAAGGLSDGEMATYRIGLQWIHDMQEACATGIWPPVPDGVEELAARF